MGAACSKRNIIELSEHSLDGPHNADDREDLVILILQAILKVPPFSYVGTQPIGDTWTELPAQHESDISLLDAAVNYLISPVDRFLLHFLKGLGGTATGTCEDTKSFFSCIN